MENTRPTRRAFLGALAGAAGGAAALPLLRRLGRVEDALATELDGLRHTTARAPLPAALRDRYLLAPGVVYLNHASIGTIPAAVHDARAAYLAACESNPWLYMWGGAWEEGRESARTSLAGLLGADASNVAITHNTTEGFNVLARGLPLGPGDEVLFSTLNHDGAAICFDHAAAAAGYGVRRFDLPPLEAARMSADELVEAHARAITDATRLLVLPHVDNMVGVRHPLTPLVEMAHARGVEWVAVDGAQTVGMIHLDLPATGVDFYAGSPHKWVQAPKGLGLLYVRPGLVDAVRPSWVTWGQARWRGTVRVLEDYGTRNLPEVLALGDAADFQAALGWSAKEARYREMRQRLRDRVASTSRLRWRSPEDWDDGASLVAVEVVGGSASELAGRLWEDHRVVLRGFGGDLNVLRVSPNVATTDEELDALCDLLEAASR